MAEDLMDKVFSLFSGDGTTDDKQNMLKQIGKEMSQNKYAKYFRVKSEETDPAFLSLLFSIYKVIYPIKQFMKDDKKLAQLRQLTVESCIDPNIQEIVKRLDISTLEQKAKTMQGEALISSIQADVELLVKQFDQRHIAAVNHRYEMAAALNQLVKYNFPGLFKKFDSHFTDGSFLVEPKFPAVKTILIIDQLGDFLTATQLLKPEEDWGGLLKLLEVCEGQELVNLEQFTAMIKTIRDLHATGFIEQMVRYTLRNPVWQWKHLALHETIGDTWLEAKKKEALGYISKVNSAKKSGQISAITKQIFESSDLTRLENYNVPLNDMYRKRGLDYFAYAEGLNYLKAFMDDYIEKDIKELCDILIIRGQWTNNSLSREMSEALHAILAITQNINDLDTVMSEEGADGSRLHAAMLRVDRDQTQVRYINSIVGKVNGEALEIINEAAQALIIIGKNLKNLIEDVQKKHPELLVNWREVNLASKEPMTQRMIDTFKKINYFIQLMRLCTQ
ncbi:MAG: DUF5312 family protein [Treponema sp.]|jgi:hypothetical protein|nr:DUF5312 family protein [Treponema sp.]